MTMRSKSFNERILHDAAFVKWCQKVLDGKSPYIELFDPLKKPLFQHFRSMHTEYSTTTADLNTTVTFHSLKKPISTPFV
ncbi:hypothetical protein CAEBREN_31830 [Caenorhabditis brenneri]|uniref:Uncharacterized protein n=1 Tax=Caenorhabditis brenneri TaxID=135651 RepID=G0PMA6_CAEBE|nr:hypothetical protein CAEBREN_31830 [Caenorhabditis brenneri]